MFWLQWIGRQWRTFDTSQFLFPSKCMPKMFAKTVTKFSVFVDLFAQHKVILFVPKYFICRLNSKMNNKKDRLICANWKQTQIRTTIATSNDDYYNDHFCLCKHACLSRLFFGLKTDMDFTGEV